MLPHKRVVWSQGNCHSCLWCIPLLEPNYTSLSVALFLWQSMWSSSLEREKYYISDPHSVLRASSWTNMKTTSNAFLLLFNMNWMFTTGVINLLSRQTTMKDSMYNEGQKIWVMQRAISVALKLSCHWQFLPGHRLTTYSLEFLLLMYVSSVLVVHLYILPLLV